MRLVQFEDKNGERGVGRVSDDGASVERLSGVDRTYDLAMRAIGQGGGLAAMADQLASGERLDYAELIADNRLLPPIDHPDPAHCLVTGTGLSHLGSAQARNDMHAKLSGEEAELTDSMKMFKLGLDGGKPDDDEIGAQPEWFWKGDGTIMVGGGQPLSSPPFALDGGEEAELAGIYVIGPDGRPWRLGFALANEFADHVMERQNYLYLAHSKLRACAVGPELRVGALPEHVEGVVRIRRGNEVVWEGQFLSGEDNMCHSIGNLEHHHFKYPLFRKPGDVHVHFFGAGVVSFASGIEPEEGDVFEIDVPAFGQPLRNPLAVEVDESLAVVGTL